MTVFGTLEARLGAPISMGTRGDTRWICPFCPSRKGTEDKSGHFYTYELSGPDGCGLFRCYRCDIGGLIPELLRKLGCEVSAKSEETFMPALHAILNPPEKPAAVAAELPRDYVPIIRGSDAYRYLLARGLSDDDLDYFHVGMGIANLYQLPEEDWRYYAGKNRAIFLDYDREGTLDYWVARSYADPPHRNKYKNAWWSASDKVFHLSRVVGPYVVICEGPLDCMVSSRYTNRNSVATYGKAVSEDKVIRLCEELPQVDTYYVALDPDAPKDSHDLASRLTMRRKEQVYIVEMPEGEDPASLGPRFPDYLGKARRFLI